MTPWGKAAASKFVQFGEYLGDQLYHDDTVADFGGNDGYAAYEFYRAHKIKPIVVDCEPKRLEHAEKVYGLPTLESFIEKMPFADKQIAYGFTSQTLEHSRDVAAALREMSRVIKRLCFFSLPLEPARHAKQNHAHGVCITRPSGWSTLINANGWHVTRGEQVNRHEYQAFAEPTT